MTGMSTRRKKQRMAAGGAGPIEPTYDGTGLWVNSAVLESMFQDMTKTIPVEDDGDLVAVAENQAEMI